MSWEILLTISVLALAVSNLLQRVLLKDDKSDPIAFSIVFQGITGVLIGLWWIANGGRIFLTGQGNLSGLLLNFILMTLLYASGNMLMCAGYKYLEASKMTIIFATRAAWPFLVQPSFSMNH